MDSALDRQGARARRTRRLAAAVAAGGEALEPLFAAGELAPPTLAEVEACLEPRLAVRDAVVQVDPWDLARLGTCPACAPARRERLARLSATGATLGIEPRVECSRCAGRS